MKQLRSYINIRKGKSIVKATDETIHKIVKDELDRLGYDADLNHIDVGEVTNMENLFNCTTHVVFGVLGSKYKDLNPDISDWNVSNVKNMTRMFKECSNFNCDLSQWDVSKVENMLSMFYMCSNFNCDLSQWDVSKVENMRYMFYKCKNFNQDISKWDISNVVTFYSMFDYCSIKEEFKPKFKNEES